MKQNCLFHRNEVKIVKRIQTDTNSTLGQMATQLTKKESSNDSLTDARMLRYLVDLANVTWSLFRLTPNVKWYHAEVRYFLPNMVNHWFFQADRYRQKSPIFLRAWENVWIESSRKRGCNPCYSCEINGLKSINPIGLWSTIRLDEWSSILRLNVVWRMIFSIVSRMWHMPSTRHRWDGKCYSSDGSHGLCNV